MNRVTAAAKEFQGFSLSLVRSLYFDGAILVVIALDAVGIGLQASEFISTKAGDIAS